MRKTLAVLFFLLLLWGNLPLSAQHSRWDDALDQYERICEECLILRERAMAGESVSAFALSGLLSRLSDLRQSLQRAEGEMTQSQRERFTRIRDRYLPRPERQSEVFPPLPPATLDLPSEAHEIDSLDSRSETVDLSSLAGNTTEQFAGAARRVPSGSRFSIGITALVSLPEGFPGLMVTARRGNFGGYVKGTCSFSPQADYEAKSDGTSSSGLIWTTGEEKYTQFSLSGGIVYSINDFLHVYAGAGYGEQEIRWEDASGKWARISDLSSRGPQGDAGIVLSFGHFLIQGGLVLRDKGNLKVEAGLGWSF